MLHLILRSRKAESDIRLNCPYSVRLTDSKNVLLTRPYWQELELIESLESERDSTQRSRLWPPCLGHAMKQGLWKLTAFWICLAYNDALRMVDGASNQEGRLEVRHNNVWGTVCNKGFDAIDASAACRSLSNRFVPEINCILPIRLRSIICLQCTQEEQVPPHQTITFSASLAAYTTTNYF